MHLAANVARVLVVEDDPADAETTCTLLRRAFGVASGASPPTSVIVETLAEACQATQVERFDLAVVDMGLPDSDGVATVAGLHACAADVPLIVITGTDEDTVTGETFAAGAQDYLVKGGFDAPLLRRTIRHALERHRASAERDALIGELRSILEHIPDMIFMKDAEELRFVRFNRAGEQLLGYSRDEMIGKNDFDLFRPKQASLFTERDREVLRSGSLDDIAEEPIDTAHGVRWLHTKKIPIYDTFGKPRFLLGISEDITERKTAHDALRRLNAELERRVEERTVQLATANEELADRLRHDSLTGLPNRNAFIDHLSRALTRARRGGAHVAVLFLDLDRFKLVNDSYGHAAGDRHLCGVARVLSALLRPGDIVARFSGDEFAILLDGSPGIVDVIHVATRIQAALAEPVPARDEVGVVTTASIGIAVSEQGDAEALVAHADAAMYRAKELGRARHEVYNNDLRDSAARRLLIERTLRAASEGNELDVDYQPEIDIATGRVTAVEALARWNHPELGRLAASDFIPIAEDCGLVPQVGGHVMGQAFAQARRWSSTAPVAVAVNLSVKELARDTIVDEVSGLLDAAGCPPDAVCLEITERSPMDLESGRRRLDQLHRLGVKIAIDDFGTGHSSLAYLTRFPIDLLKIDKSLIAGLGVEHDDTVVVHAIIRLAHALDLTLVAEGVETPGQLQVLTDLGCDLAQGHHIAVPASAAAITPLLGRSLGPGRTDC